MASENLFELLKNIGIRKHKDIDKVFQLDNESIKKFIHIFTGFINDGYIDINEIPASRYNFIASDYMGGSRDMCSHLPCRSNRLSELAYFASLYSDCVLIRNPFDDLIDQEIDDDLRIKIVEDLILLWHIKPLLEGGYVKFSRTKYHICKDCLKEIQFATDEKRLNEASSYVNKHMADTVKCYFINENGNPHLELVASNRDILEHDMLVNFTHYIPKSLEKYLKKEGKYILSSKEVSESGAYEFIINNIVDDFGMQDWYTRNLNYNYITNRQIDINLINELCSHPKRVINNNINSSIQHLLPIINTPRLDELVALRKKEGLAFIEYRKAFSAVLSLIEQGEYNIGEAMADIVIPEIEKIKKTIKDAKNSKLITIGKEVAITSGLLGVGLYSGILPRNIEELLPLIGGFELTKTLIKEVSVAKKSSADIDGSPYYFLWKCAQ